MTQEAYRCGRRIKASGWDALDQLSDEPQPHEVIHVYEWFEHHEKGAAFVDGARNGRRFGGRISLSEDNYRHIPMTAEEAERLRDTTAWREWCRARASSGDVPAV